MARPGHSVSADTRDALVSTAWLYSGNSTAFRTLPQVENVPQQHSDMLCRNAGRCATERYCFHMNTM